MFGNTAVIMVLQYRKVPWSRQYLYRKNKVQQYTGSTVVPSNTTMQQVIMWLLHRLLGNTEGDHLSGNMTLGLQLWLGSGLVLGTQVATVENVV